MSAILGDMSVTFNFMQNKFQIGLGLLKLSLAQCGHWCLVTRKLTEFDAGYKTALSLQREMATKSLCRFFKCVKFCRNICMAPTCARFSSWCLRLRCAPGAPAGANCSLYSAGRPSHNNTADSALTRYNTGPDTHCPHCGGTLRTLYKSLPTKVVTFSRVQKRAWDPGSHGNHLIFVIVRL